MAQRHPGEATEVSSRRCPFAGDRRTPPVTVCSGYVAARVALGPVGADATLSAPTCAHLEPMQGHRGWVPACGRAGGPPPDARLLLATLMSHGRRGAGD